jgi:hypothetical protein
MEYSDLVKAIKKEKEDWDIYNAEVEELYLAIFNEIGTRIPEDLSFLDHKTEEALSIHDIYYLDDGWSESIFLLLIKETYIRSKIKINLKIKKFSNKWKVNIFISEFDIPLKYSGTDIKSLCDNFFMAICDDFTNSLNSWLNNKQSKIGFRDRNVKDYIE